MTNSTTPPPPPLLQKPSSQSFSSVPDEVAASCLARISKSHYPSLSSVSKSFHSLLSSPEIYAARSKIGATEPRLYLCLRLPTATRHRWFTLRTPDQTRIKSRRQELFGEEVGLSLVPVKHSSSYACARSNAAIVAVGFEIYQIGGSDKNKRSRAVRVLDCRSHTRRLPPYMTVARKSAKACVLDGKIYVTGGCRKREEPNSWGEVFDIKTQTWKEEPLPSPSGGEFDRNYKVVAFGERLYVITMLKKYAYDPIQGRWLPEMGFLRLELITTARTHWCVMENIVFNQYGDKFWWYDLSRGKWSMVEGLGDLYTKHACGHRTIQLVNHGGKLVIVTRLYCRRKRRPQDKRTWFAVIRLEKRLTSSGSEELWGEIERFNPIDPGSYHHHKLVTCLSVSL